METCIAQLIERFGDAGGISEALEIELSRVQRWIDEPDNVTVAEGCLIRFLSRALDLGILDILLVDRFLLSPSDNRPPALTFILASGFENIITVQDNVIEVQQLIITYYERTAAEKKGNAKDVDTLPDPLP